jgi:UDP-glucose 4-epimerase
VKILVTGGAGFIGMNLIKKLVSEGRRVVCLDDYSTGTKSNHIDGVKYINGDIETIEYLKGDYDLCYHLAAQSRVQPSFDDPTESFRINVNGTRAVCDWAKNNNVKIIYAGSSSKHHDPTDSPYAMYKYLGEEVCKLYKKSFDVDIEICRFYNVYGPGESLDEKYGSVIGIWRTKVSKIQALPIVGDGEQKRDFIHVDDIVDGLIKIGFGSEKHEDAWELGVGVNYTINEIYRWFNERFWIESTYIPEQKGNYRETLNTNTDTKERLGWEPKDRLKEYIQSL